MVDLDSKYITISSQVFAINQFYQEWWHIWSWPVFKASTICYLTWFDHFELVFFDRTSSSTKATSARAGSCERCLGETTVSRGSPRKLRIASIGQSFGLQFPPLKTLNRLIATSASLSKPLWPLAWTRIGFSRSLTWVNKSQHLYIKDIITCMEYNMEYNYIIEAT